jgi:hypothetical protein
MIVSRLGLVVKTVDSLTERGRGDFNKAPVLFHVEHRKGLAMSRHTTP